MARTPWDDPVTEAQYQDNAVENRNVKMAGEVKQWPYSANDVMDNWAKSMNNASNPKLGPKTPGEVIKFDPRVKVKPKSPGEK